jgi:heme A synthase
VILGGLVRHTGAGRACGTDIPGCGGELWPALGQGQLHQAHRLAGLLLGLVLLAAAPVLVRGARRAGRRAATLAAAALPAVVVAQVVLGILTVTSGIGVWQAVAHTGGAALLLACCLGVAFGLGPLLEPAPSRASARAWAPASEGAA